MKGYGLGTGQWAQVYLSIPVITNVFYSTLTNSVCSRRLEHLGDVSLRIEFILEILQGRSMLLIDSSQQLIVLKTNEIVCFIFVAITFLFGMITWRKSVSRPNSIIFECIKK